MEWKVHYFDRRAGQDGVSIDERGRMAYREAIQHPRARCETLAT
jgi:hypothetical protein